MKRLAVGLACLLWGSAGGQEDSAVIERVGWLAGCWEQRSERAITEEQWMAPRGGTMIGMSRTVAGGRTTAHEHLRIETREGRLVYVALPSGQAETEFVQVELGDSIVVFENAAHDFPQRIRYRLLENGDVLAQIEGQQQGRSRVIDFPMTRVRTE